VMGNMEPVQEETFGPLVPLRGALPGDLDGRFVRNGPNPALEPFGRPGYHEFSGDAMLHAVDLKGGVGSYLNRWVQTKKKQAEAEKGQVLQRAELMGADGSFLGAANTNLVLHAKQLMALYEADRPYVLSVPALETMGQATYGGQLAHNMTAHPKVCPVTGELIFFGYDLMAPMVHYSVADREGKLLRTLDIPTRGGKPVMMHDMAITQNYSILLEFPLYFELKSAMKGDKMPYVHDTSSPSHFAVLPRHASSVEEVRWFQGTSAMAFHIANAWEEGEAIKVVGCPTDRFSFSYAESSPSVLREWTFDLSSGRTEERQLDGTRVEFPVIHPQKTGAQNRYVWAAVFAGPGAPFHSISGCLKHDLSTGRTVRHDFVGNRWGGESVFAPRVGASAEDDGYLLTYTYNSEDGSTELYVVDARAMGPEPVAILRTPQRVPFGFHGIWLPREDCS